MPHYLTYRLSIGLQICAAGFAGSARLVGAGRDSGGETSAVGVIVFSALEPPAIVAGLDNVAVMGQPVEQRGGHFGVDEHARPFAEGEIGGHDEGGALINWLIGFLTGHRGVASREVDVGEGYDNCRAGTTQLPQPNGAAVRLDLAIRRDDIFGSPGAGGSFASELYDPADYIRDYNAFLSLLNR